MTTIDLRTLTRVTLVVGVGLILVPCLMLLEPDSSAPVWFQRGMRLQILVGCIVVVIGLAFWHRQAWARGAAILLLRAGATGAALWQIYGVFSIASSSPSLPFVIGGVVVGVVGMVVWVAVFRRGVAYLNQPELIAELEGRAQ